MALWSSLFLSQLFILCYLLQIPNSPKKNLRHYSIIFMFSRAEYYSCRKGGIIRKMNPLHSDQSRSDRLRLKKERGTFICHPTSAVIWLCDLILCRSALIFFLISCWTELARKRKDNSECVGFNFKKYIYLFSIYEKYYFHSLKCFCFFFHVLSYNNFFSVCIRCADAAFLYCNSFLCFHSNFWEKVVFVLLWKSV